MTDDTNRAANGSDIYGSEPADCPCSHGPHEDAMVTVRRNANGTPTVWCDPCIADLVDTLNPADGTVSTVASCCGHGALPGCISLADGRELSLPIRQALINWGPAVTAHAAALARKANQPMIDKPRRAGIADCGSVIAHGPHLGCGGLEYPKPEEEPLTCDAALPAPPDPGRCTLPNGHNGPHAASGAEKP